MFKKLLDAYGSFFGLTHPLSKSLLLLCTLMHPVVGLMGVIGALSVLTSRKLLGFSGENEYVEVVNGLLLGMLFGSFYQCDAGAVCLTVIGGLLVVLVSAMLTETMTKHFRLPLLGLPYVVVAYLMLPFVQYCPLLPAFPPPAAVIPDLHNAALDWLSPLGAIYFNGTAAGGLIVLLALAVSSRYLAALGLMSCMMLTALLNMLAVPDLLL
ncbi:MAG TPA: urea transporter, partial [Candidatus Obscuribacterales bacterium]